MLIHEASMEDDLVEDAIKKKHRSVDFFPLLRHGTVYNTRSLTLYRCATPVF